jgi:SAM-dependent methyltransferase
MSGHTTKQTTELDFWINVWNKKIIETGCWTEDVYSLIGEEKRIDSYDQQREKEGKAQGFRILSLAQKPRDYFDNKVVVEIGPGCCGLLEMSNARVKVAIEPLAEQYRAHGLLLKNERGAAYLTCGSESIPLMSDYADIVVASNCLDHVEDIRASVSEIYRILKVGGEFFLNVEIDHPPSVCEPHSLTFEDVLNLFKEFETVFIRTDVNADSRKWVRAVYKKGRPSE